MASDAESSLLSKLESSDDPESIHALVSDHLRPFARLLNPKKPSKKQPQTAVPTVRSLAKQFLHFINKSLSILPRRLSKQDPTQHSLLPLFDTYRLCLDCLELVSSQLSCAPHTVQIQRIRLVHSLEVWARYAEAQTEAFRVLERLRSGADLKGTFLPSAEGRGGRSGDAEFAMVVVDAVAAIVKCLAMGQSRDCEEYRTVLAIVEEVRPWFRVLDASSYEKLHKLLLTSLGKCTLFLVMETHYFDGDLVCEFCIASLIEYVKSPNKDQIYKFARRIFSSLYSIQGLKCSVAVDIPKCVLSFIARQCKVEMDDNIVEFVELVAYCANKCRTAGTSFCGTLARHLNDMAGDFHQAKTLLHLILRLYATGLDFIEAGAKSSDDDFISSGGTEDDSPLRILFIHEDKLHNLIALLHPLESYVYIGPEKNCIASGVEYQGSVSPTDLKNQASITCIQKNGRAYLLLYLNAMRFLCQPLAELVNSEKKRIIAEIDSSSLSSKLCGIQDVFYQFCDTFFSLHSCTSETERHGFDDKMTILSVLVAGFILSVCTKLKMQKNVHLIKQMISIEWVQPQGLRYLSASLYNTGVLLYRSKLMKEASKVLKLSHRASWTCVELLCQMFVSKPEGFSDCLSEDALINFINEACTRSASLLEVLHQCGNVKVKRIIVESLENWSLAANSFSVLPGPMPLVKQWVKMQCKLHNIVAEEDSASSLFFLLSSSMKVSKRTIVKILEQELLAYEEMNPWYPDFCQRMQMNIIDLLLQDVCATQYSPLQKSRILIRKGGALRASGVKGLKDCIWCLSEAVSIMKNICGELCISGTALSHQLATAYCLRALCTQEDEPNSEQIFEDISAALDLWLSIPIPDRCSVDDEFNMASAKVLLMLYNIVDLLAMKGCTKFHSSIYQLIIEFYKGKNLPLEKCLAILWESRRLSHALCVSPVNEAFIMKLSEHCGEISKSIDFWLRCLDSSKPLLVGFRQNLSFFFNAFACSFNNHKRDLQFAVTINDVKEVVSGLISSDPVPIHSAFLAGSLYYDLCERLISNGRLHEALSYAKEAHKLRTQVFQEKFTCSVEQQFEKHMETGDTCQKIKCGPKYVREVWSFDSSSWDLDSCYLSPWNVLQCYLESTFQVGIIHEMTGNGVEAETFLSWGKNISSLQSLPIFKAAFSSVLGKLYRKKRLWDLAEKELQSAKQILLDSSKLFSCSKCTLMLEVNVDHQLGDLFRSLSDSAPGRNSTEKLSYAEKLYRSAHDKLNHSEWKNTINCCKEDCAKSVMLRRTIESNRQVNSTACANSEADELDVVDVGKCRRTRKAPKSVLKEQHPIHEHGSRMTRSRYRSSQNQTITSVTDVQVGLSEHSNSNIVSESGGEIACICKQMKCWQCFPIEVVKSGVLDSFLNIKWEFARRRLAVRVLAGIGKCLGCCGRSHEAHEVILQSISVIVSSSIYNRTCSSIQIPDLLDLVGKQLSGDSFVVERAAILYNTCWILLTNFHSKDSRIVCCDLSRIQLSKIVLWLKIAFLLSREVPLLFQKVSRLLAAIYLLSATNEKFSFSSSSQALSESHWASYFHQASLGTHLNYHFVSNIGQRYKDQHVLNPEGSFVTSSTSSSTGMPTLSRLAPDSIEDLEQYVISFFMGLPCTTIICLSLLGGAYAVLLKELLPYHSCIHAWILLSRLNSENQPVVILLPVDSVLEVSDDDDASSNSWKLPESLKLEKHWHCPWGSTVVDDVAPAFKEILEWNYLSSSVFPLEDTKKNRSLWWMRRMKLDQHLGTLLRNLEDSWLGSWRYVLLGDCLNCQSLDLTHKKLVRDLRSKCKLDVNESLLKLLLGGAKYGVEETCLSQLCLKKGCYVGTVEHDGEDIYGSSSNTTNGIDKEGRLAFQLIHEAVNKLDEEDDMTREPVMLVLDCDIQMLPWESMPILRNQEVYRMPSVGSISITLERSCHNQEQVGRVVSAFPLIDPLDAFFLLNPSGDLSSTQVEFENWFRDQNFEGMAGSVPTAKELATALKSHDLFIYFGHGSGAQYIPGHEIQKLEQCAATLLMGCSSGSLSLNGCYIPRGTPLSYLLAGSPVIVANLWEVTDKDIDRFAKAMLDACLRERSELENCSECNLLVKKFDAMHLKGSKGNPKKKVQSKKLPETSHGDSCKNSCDHGPKIGSFMGLCREACTLPFLIGASPVCYGVPTRIRRKKDL